MISTFIKLTNFFFGYPLKVAKSVSVNYIVSLAFYLYIYIIYIVACKCRNLCIKYHFFFFAVFKIIYSDFLMHLLRVPMMISFETTPEISVYDLQRRTGHPCSRLDAYKFYTFVFLIFAVSIPITVFYNFTVLPSDMKIFLLNLIQYVQHIDSII